MKKNEVKRKARWTEEEDEKLRNYVSSNGSRHWNSMARQLDLGRSGNSCRLRWVNYLSFLRRGKINDEEKLLIIKLQSECGNKWSKIARQLPGRTDNDVKNFWHTRVLKRQPKQKRAEPALAATSAFTSTPALMIPPPPAALVGAPSLTNTADDSLLMLPPPAPPVASAGGSTPAVSGAYSFTDVVNISAAGSEYSSDLGSCFWEHAHLWNPANQYNNYYLFDL